MVSFIQSNYRNFGSGIVVPGTGISLNDRAFSFSLDEKHHNALRGGKRPYHTIIPGFITRGGEAVGPFGVMGEYMQPQGQLQAVVNMLDGGMDAAQAFIARTLDFERRERDYIALLQEAMQAQRKALPVYSHGIDGGEGAHHDFTVTVCAGGRTFSGRGANTAEAKRNAAKTAYDALFGC